MAATPGNQWWKLRSKHGRDAIFTSPEILESACEEYFKATDERNDWDGQDWVGKDGEEVVVEKRVPYSIKGLCVFLGVSSHYFNDNMHPEYIVLALLALVVVYGVGKLIYKNM